MREGTADTVLMELVMRMMKSADEVREKMKMVGAGGSPSAAVATGFWRSVMELLRACWAPEDPRPSQMQ